MAPQKQFTKEDLQGGVDFTTPNSNILFTVKDAGWGGTQVSWPGSVKTTWYAMRWALYYLNNNIWHAKR